MFKATILCRSIYLSNETMIGRTNYHLEKRGGDVAQSPSRLYARLFLNLRGISSI